MSPPGRGFLDAAYQILKEAGRPLHGREIVQACLERGLWVTDAQDPNLSGTTTPYSEIRRHPNRRGFTMLGNGQFGLREWGKPPAEPDHMPAQAPGAGRASEAARPEPAPVVRGGPRREHQEQRGGPPVVLQSPATILTSQMASIRSFLHGRSDRPSDERLCDWVHFCYEFGLFREGRDLFGLIDPTQVNDWYYERTKRLARVCAMRVAEQA